MEFDFNNFSIVLILLNFIYFSLKQLDSDIHFQDINLNYINMKIKHLLFVCIGALALHACSSDEEILNAPNGGVGETAGTSVELVVPVGCRTIRIDYPTASGIESMTASISPVAKVISGQNVSPITNTTVNIVSSVDTYVNIYDENDTKLVENFPIMATSLRAASAGNIMIPEDAVNEYVTSDGPFTFYHSSGVAMFDDSWPFFAAIVDADFSDVVVDYDIEAKTVNMNQAPNQSWRECVKVVMHLRTVGGMFPEKVGLVLEGLDSKYIDNYEAKLTLGNWNEVIPPNSLSSTVDISGAHPIITLNNIDWVTSTDATHATYINSKTGKNQKVNISGAKYYNVEPGFINVGGDLFTLTVTFRGKDRSVTSKAEGDAMIANFIGAVMNTETQNFFINTDTRHFNVGNFEIHMKGYNPTDAYSSIYPSASTIGVAKDNSTTYCDNQGYVWGFKVPVLTRHAWEETSFFEAYPEYEAWVKSNGAVNKEWYKHPEGSKISIWW